MPNSIKNFKTISRAAGPVIYREKKSRFLGYAFPTSSLEAADQELATLKKQYADATHVCYAYRIGIENTLTRMNDDGEPAYTAGSPILGQIASADLYDVLVCIVRYYGGIKLGAGGLSKAYKETAREILKISPVKRLRAVSLIRLQFQYPHLEEVMAFISQNRLKVRTRKMTLDCSIELVVSHEKSEAYCNRLQSIDGVQIHKRDTYL